jgi:hypothetical protein
MGIEPTSEAFPIPHNSLELTDQFNCSTPLHSQSWPEAVEILFTAREESQVDYGWGHGARSAERQGPTDTTVRAATRLSAY